MASLVVSPGVEVDVNDFFPSGSLTSGELLSGLVSQVGDLDLLGQGTIVTNFGEYVVQSGGRTIRYLGDFVSNIVQSLLGSTSGVTGSFDRIIIEEAGEIIADLKLDDLLGVDLGELTSGGLLGGLLDLDGITDGLLGDLLGGSLGDLLGGLDEPVDEVLDTVQVLLDNVLGGLDPTDGDDDITGTDDDDVIDGGPGDDTIHGGDGNDTLTGGPGNDHLYGDAGNDTLIGSAGKDFLYGGIGDDKLYGNSGRDFLSGDDGNDRLEGGSAKDRLEGGAGNDVLIGGAGRDTLDGGAGADTFLFEARNDSKATSKGMDLIRDFSQQEGDHIDLSEFNVDFVGRARFSGDDGEVRFAFKGNDTLISVDINGDGRADMGIKVDGRVDFTAGDFIL